MTQDLAGRAHWEARPQEVARRLPSKLNIDVRVTVKLLGRYINRQSRVLEVGCAPGKYLLWCAMSAGADVSGVEYAPLSAQATAKLFSDMGVPIDLRIEDFMHTTFEPSFQLVYSLGVIEHFVDPRPMVRKHVEMLAPGGVALIVVPNYGGIYGRLQGILDPKNLAIHNRHIMNQAALAALAPTDIPSTVRAFAYGHVTPWILSLDKALPRLIARLVSLAINGIGHIQPAMIQSLAPWLVLEIRRSLHD